MFTLFTKKFKLSASALDAKMSIEWALEHTPKGNIRMHFKSWTNNFRRLVESEHHSMLSFLKELGISYITGNDAPRGGVEGDYIELTRKEAKRCLIKLSNLTQSYPRTKRQTAIQLKYFN